MGLLLAASRAGAVKAPPPSLDAREAQLRLERADVTITVSVSTAGKPTTVATVGGDRAGTDVDECLGRAAAAWSPPAGDADHAVDVPLTAIRTDAGR